MVDHKISRERGVHLNSFDEASTTLTPNTNQGQYKKGKLQAVLNEEYRYRNSKHYINKLNLVRFKKMTMFSLLHKCKINLILEN